MAQKIMIYNINDTIPRISDENVIIDLKDNYPSSLILGRILQLSKLNSTIEVVIHTMRDDVEELLHNLQFPILKNIKVLKT